MERLVGRAKDGDIAARDRLVDQFYESWRRRFHGKLGKALRARGNTRTLIHSALVDIYAGLPRLRDDGKFAAFAGIVIWHKLCKWRRDANRTSVEERIRDEPLSPSEPIEEIITRDESVVRLLETMKWLALDLPNEMGVVFEKGFQGVSFAEIGRVGHAPPTTVRDRYRRGGKFIARRKRLWEKHPNELTVVFLRDVEHMSFADIAADLSLAESEVKRLYAGGKALIGERS